MAKTDFKTVNEYLAAQPKPVQKALRAVRRAIRAAVPGGEEVISYQMPGYKVKGLGVLAYAGWKEHYSLYPSSRELEAAFKDELTPYGLSGKGTIRFPVSEPVPVKLIAAIAKFRVRQAAEREKRKVAARKAKRR